MGQIGANPLCRARSPGLPEAQFIPSRGPIRDFEIIRRSRNVVVSVSTFSWLAAWLSDADRIFLPMTGFYNPAQFPEIDLLPLHDPRYRFYLFPVNYAVPVEQHEAAHRALGGMWRYMRPEMIEELRGRRPRFGSPARLFHAAFDEDFYLARYQGLREAVDRGAFKSGFEHYVMFGYFERRDPFPSTRSGTGGSTRSPPSRWVRAISPISTTTISRWDGSGDTRRCPRPPGGKAWTSTRGGSWRPGGNNLVRPAWRDAVAVR